MPPLAMITELKEIITQANGSIQPTTWNDFANPANPMTPTAEMGMVKDSNGDLWCVEIGVAPTFLHILWKIDKTTGAWSFYLPPVSPFGPFGYWLDLAISPVDGKIYISDNTNGGGPGQIVCYDPVGPVWSFFPSPSGAGQILAIKVNGAGNIVISDNNRLWIMSPAGAILNPGGYPTPIATIGGLAIDSANNMWITPAQGGPPVVAKCTLGGVWALYGVQIAPPFPGMIAGMPVLWWPQIVIDGSDNVWFTQPLVGSGNRIGKLTPLGVYSYIAIASNNAPLGLALGPNGIIYCISADGGSNQQNLLRVDPTGSPSGGAIIETYNAPSPTRLNGCFQSIFSGNYLWCVGMQSDPFQGPITASLSWAHQISVEGFITLLTPPAGSSLIVEGIFTTISTTLCQIKFPTSNRWVSGAGWPHPSICLVEGNTDEPLGIRGGGLTSLTSYKITINYRYPGTPPPGPTGGGASDGNGWWWSQ